MPRCVAVCRPTPYLVHRSRPTIAQRSRTGSSNEAELAMADIQLTARAAKRINEIMSQEPPGSSLRISVNGGGCSGFSYAFDIEQIRTEEDLVIEKDGATV